MPALAAVSVNGFTHTTKKNTHGEKSDVMPCDKLVSPKLSCFFHHQLLATPNLAKDG